MDVSVIAANLPDLLAGAAMTVWLTVATLLPATLLAVPLAVLRTHGPRPWRRVAATYSALARATPTLVLVFLAYYGLPALGLVLPALPTAVAGLVLSATAYVAEIIRAGLLSVPLGQRDAACALGLPPWQAWRRVVLPQAMPVIVPIYVSNAGQVLKGTSVASLVTVSELSARASEVAADTYRPIEILLTATLIYLLLWGAILLAGTAAGRGAARWSHA